MANENNFLFALEADDKVSASIQRIDEAVKNMLPNLDKTQDKLKLGGKESVEGLDNLGYSFKGISSNAKDGVQLIGDMVPPLKMVAGLSVGIGGLATVINSVKNGLEDFASSGYRIETTAKNISMTTDAFQRLTGAMIENGSARKDAEDSISDLFVRANEAAHGRGDQGIVAILHKYGIGIGETKEGLADVNKLIEDLGAQMQNISPGDQALIARKLGLSPELLKYLRLSTDQVKRLKDQAQRDGLIWSPKALENAGELYNEFNRTSAAWDGLKMRFNAGLGGLLAGNTTGTKLDSARNRVNQDQSIVDTLDNSEYLKSQLSSMERAALKFGILTDGARKIYEKWYGARDAAAQLQNDVNGLYVKPPAPVPQPGGINPYAPSVRNNNPWNMRYAGQQGAIPDPSMAKEPFARFSTPEQGVLAADNQLQLYTTGRSKNVDHPLTTLREIISTASPWRDRNNTEKMINDASGELRVNPDQPLSFNDVGFRARFLAAVFNREGNNPYTAEQIQQIIQGNDSQTITAPVVTPPPGINPLSNGGPSINARNINSPIGISLGINEAIANAMKDNKMQVEITLINSSTGEKTTLVAKGGRKVTTSMDF